MSDPVATPQTSEESSTEVKGEPSSMSTDSVQEPTQQGHTGAGSKQNGNAENVQGAVGLSAPLRENMIATAVKFLLNPQVQNSPLSQRRAFLKKKGLTDDEIKVAIERSGVKDPSPSLPPKPGQQLPPSAVSSYNVATPPPVPPAPTLYSRGRDFAAIAVIISGVTYGLYKLFQKFIRPFFKRQEDTQKRLQNIETSIAQLNNTLAATVQDIQKSVGLMQTLLERQEGRLDQISRDLIANKAIVSGRGEGDVLQIKQEITSLKGLLLNRSQFPSTPQQSSIPAWQKKSSLESEKLQLNDTLDKEMDGGQEEENGSQFEDEDEKENGYSQTDGGDDSQGVHGMTQVNGEMTSLLGSPGVNLKKKTMLENGGSIESNSGGQTSEKAVEQNGSREEEEVD